MKSKFPTINSSTRSQCVRRPFDPSLALYLKLTDNANTSPRDESILKNTCTITGSAKVLNISATAGGWTTGKYGNAYSVGGASTSIKSASSSLYDWSGAFTISAWVYITDAETQQAVFSYDIFRFVFGNNLGGTGCTKSLAIIQSGVATPYLSANNVVTTGWHYLTFSKITAADGWRCWIDGVQLTAVGNTSMEYSHSGYVYVGSWSASNYFLTGRICHLRYWKKLLTTEQITKEMNSAVPIERKSLLASWEFSEGSGTTVTSDHYTVYNTVPASEGVTFNGIDSYISCGNVASSNKLSVFAWVNNAAQVSKVIIGKYDTGVNQRCWRIGSNATTGATPAIILTDNGTVDAGHYRNYTSSLTFLDDTWHHVGFTFDGTKLRIYVDGVEDTSPTKTQDDAITSIYAATTPLTIGGSLLSGASTANFSGSVKNARVYYRVLDAGEVMALYQSETGL